jgi:hypothetical protein
VVTGGARYDIRQPDQLLVAREVVVIGLPADAPDGLYESSEFVGLAHVIRLEPLPTPSPATRKDPLMAKLYVTFTSPGSQTFGPYASLCIDPADDADTLLLLVSDTGDNPRDEDQGRCLASRVDGLWQLGHGLQPAQDGLGFMRVHIGPAPKG